jgi:hypothetical protein
MDIKIKIDGDQLVVSLLEWDEKYGRKMEVASDSIPLTELRAALR